MVLRFADVWLLPLQVVEHLLDLIIQTKPFFGSLVVPRLFWFVLKPEVLNPIPTDCLKAFEGLLDRFRSFLGSFVSSRPVIPGPSFLKRPEETQELLRPRGIIQEVLLLERKDNLDQGEKFRDIPIVVLVTMGMIEKRLDSGE